MRETTDSSLLSFCFGICKRKHNKTQPKSVFLFIYTENKVTHSVFCCIASLNLHTIHTCAFGSWAFISISHSTLTWVYLSLFFFRFYHSFAWFLQWTHNFLPFKEVFFPSFHFIYQSHRVIFALLSHRMNEWEISFGFIPSLSLSLQYLLQACPVPYILCTTRKKKHHKIWHLLIERDRDLHEYSMTIDTIIYLHYYDCSATLYSTLLYSPLAPSPSRYKLMMLSHRRIKLVKWNV